MSTGVQIAFDVKNEMMVNQSFFIYPIDEERLMHSFQFQTLFVLCRIVRSWVLCTLVKNIAKIANLFQL